MTGTQRYRTFTSSLETGNIRLLPPIRNQQRQGSGSRPQELFDGAKIRHGDGYLTKGKAGYLTDLVLSMIQIVL